MQHGFLGDTLPHTFMGRCSVAIGSEIEIQVVFKDEWTLTSKATLMFIY